MTILRQPHVCDLPYPDRTGTIFRCDECGRLCRSRAPGNPDYAGWYRLGPLGRWWWVRRRGLPLDGGGS